MTDYTLADQATPNRKTKPASLMETEIRVKVHDPLEKGDRRRPAACVECEVVCTHPLVRDSRPFSSPRA
jgi:hypothetical protein